MAQFRSVSIHRRRSARWAASLLVSTAFIPEVALAQVTSDAPAAPDTALADGGAPESGSALAGDIVVTARRREERLQDVPIAITAIGQETLANLRVTNAEDIEILEPSFSVSPASGYANRPVYSLRGIRPTEAIYGQDPTVAIYLADVVQSPSAGSNLGFYDLENVQVLKGPQGTLFGRNTVGGALLLTPRKPGTTFGGNILAGIGTHGLVETEVGLDIPLAETFRVRFAGRTIDSDGYQTVVSPGPLEGTHQGGEQLRSMRVTAVWDVTPEIENTTIFTYDDRETNGRGMRLVAVNPAHPLAGNQPALTAAANRTRGRDVHDIEADIRAYDNVSAWGLINTTVAELSDTLTLKSILSYREVDTETSQDSDSAAGVVALQVVDQFANLRHGGAELQLQGTGLDDRLNWVTGLYYYHEEGQEFSPGFFYPALLPINPIQQDATVKNDSYSVFAQASFKLTPELTLTGGARYNWDHRQMTLMNRDATGCSLRVSNGAGGTTRLPADQCALPLKKNFEQPTGTVSLDYKAAPGVLLYATSRLGYRSGGFNLRADIPAEYVPFNPETVIDAELGAKTDWAIGDIRMRTNVAVYKQWYDDIQRTVAVENAGGSPGSSVVNAASATVFGLELQQTIQPTDALTFQFNYTYIKPKYKRWEELTASGALVDVSDTPFFFTPRHSGNVSVNYEQPLAGDLGTVHFTVNAAYTDEVFINALHTSRIIALHPAAIMPLLKQEDYWLVDASAGVRDIKGTGIDVMAYVRNLIDKEYKTGGIQLYTGATGFIAAAYGPPRSYGMQIRYRF